MTAEPIPKNVKKEISRLRSEVRKIQKHQSNIEKKDSAFQGAVASGNYWTQTGMPWVSSEGRKAVLTEYFWQPIRGQPRRVDTNELRQFSQTSWVNSCVKTIIDEIASLEWDIIPKEEYEYDWVKDEITEVKEWLKYPNKNRESFNSILRSLIRDILEIDAGVLVKVFSIDSYDFDELEPKSGAPMLKPQKERRMTELYCRDGASFLKEIDKFGFRKGYWQYSYQIPAHPMWFNDPEIVYFSEQSRSMSCYGYARTQAIMDLLKSLHYSTLYNKRFFEETPIPDGALSLLDTNEAEYKAFLNFWNSEFKAQPHKLAVINKDVKWQPFNVSQRELEFLETQKWYYNLVISMFGLTPSEMGITEDVNRATSATQSELVKRKSIRPFLRLLENYLNEGVIDEFGYDGIQFQFIYDDPAEKNARLTNWQLELNMGIKTINEVRDELGLEPIEGGDTNSMSNNNMFSIPSMPNQQDLGSPEENRESQGYEDSVSREEANNESKKSLDPLQNLIIQAADNTGFGLDQLRQGFEVENEHRESLNLNDQQVMQIAIDHLIEDPQYYTKLEQVEKGYVSPTGPYYNEQPISQPKRRSGADFQPQNPDPTDTVPSPLVADQRRPEFEDINQINCPICGMGTLNFINANEGDLPEDIRCIQCGARFRSNELLGAKEMEEVSNILMMNNITSPVTIPTMKPKSFKKKDIEMTLKEFIGFDYVKSLSETISYVDSSAYRSKLKRYLSNLSAKQFNEVINVIKQGISQGMNIGDIARGINDVIDDWQRSQLIAKTEVIRVANKGNLAMAKERGFDKVEFIAAPEDGRLCRKCKEKDGKIYDIKSAQNIIPVHPRCRCSWTEYVEL